jgi:hypothetical protein
MSHNYGSVCLTGYRRETTIRAENSYRPFQTITIMVGIMMVAIVGREPPLLSLTNQVYLAVPLQRSQLLFGDSLVDQTKS